jgi:hypothetical protein
MPYTVSEKALVQRRAISKKRVALQKRGKELLEKEMKAEAEAERVKNEVGEESDSEYEMYEDEEPEEPEKEEEVEEPEPVKKRKRAPKPKPLSDDIMKRLERLDILEKKIASDEATAAEKRKAAAENKRIEEAASKMAEDIVQTRLSQSKRGLVSRYRQRHIRLAE